MKENYKDIFSLIIFAIFTLFYYLHFNDYIHDFIENPKGSSFFVLFIVSFFATFLGGTLHKVQKIILQNSNDKVDEIVNDIIQNSRYGGLTAFFLIAILIPLIEELIFRVIPYLTVYTTSLSFSYGTGKYIAIIFTFIWVLLHGRRFFVLIPAGIFYYLLLVNGLILQAALLHMINNSYSILIKIISIYQKWDKLYLPIERTHL